MAYNSNIPQPNDQLSVSQGQILGNFQEIGTAFNLNHGAFNSGIEGLHAFVQMPAQTPTIATAAGQVALYAKTNALTTVPELYFQRQSLAADSGIPISATGSAVISGITIHYAYLPSGILLKWGNATTDGTGNLTVAINGAGLPTTSTLFTVSVTSGGVGTITAVNANYGLTILQNNGSSQFSAYSWTPAGIGGGGVAFPNAGFTFVCIGV